MCLSNIKTLSVLFTGYQIILGDFLYWHNVSIDDVHVKVNEDEVA